MQEVDQPRAMGLVELLIELVDRALAPGGAFITKRARVSVTRSAIASIA